MQLPHMLQTLGYQLVASAMTLSAFALNCSPKSSAEVSSTEKTIGGIVSALESPHGVSSCGTVRVADREFRPGVITS